MSNLISRLAKLDLAIIDLQQAQQRLADAGAHSSAALARTALTSAQGARRKAIALVQSDRPRSSSAFEITADDVYCVLAEHALRVTDTQGKSFETLAAELIDEIDHARIEAAALASGSDLEDQTRGALAEIKDHLVELQVLEF